MPERPLSSTNADQGAILLTGVSGLLGGELLKRILEQTDRSVVATVRRPLDFEHDRLELLTVDLAEEGSVPNPGRDDITTVIHCAASVSFDLPLDEQRAINVEGTRRLLELAAQLPNLERFMHVSTAYVAGLHEGPFGPTDLDIGQGFRNSYEQSKLEAEVLVRASGLPVQVVRPSIVVGDRNNGHTNAFNVLYPPMRAYAKGRMSVAPGREEAPVDVVPIDIVADGMMALLGVPVGDTHLIVAGDNSPTVGDLIELGAARFNRTRGTVVAPDVLAGIIRDLPDDQRVAAEQAIERAASVLPYFDVRCTFVDPATSSFLAERGLSVPPLREYFDHLMDYAEATDWGRAPQPAQV